jgi:surface carbohydrate biosynthesis protein (TIGR04326 family)
MTGIDLSPVLRAELRADQRTTRAELSFLAYRAALRIPLIFPVSTFIYTFENHMWEKMFCAGFRKASPRTMLVGYAHSIVSPMYLSYSLSRLERETAPLPDRIAVNGPRARENLVASGFPAERVVVTGSFRYPHFGRGRPPLEDRQERSVLVPLTAGIDESLELALKAVLALGGMPGIRTVLKPHPSISRETLLSYLPDLPPAVETSSDPVDRLLDRTDLVLFTSTTVAVEALGRGIPLVHVKSDLAIDRNILEGFPMVPSAADPEEIREMAVRVLENRETVGEEGKKAVLDLITPSGEGSIDILLGDRT